MLSPLLFLSALGGLACVPAARHESALQESAALQASYSEQRRARQASNELARLYHADRWDRSGQADWRTLEQNDAERLARVREIDAAGQIRAPVDHYHAALIYQHGGHTEDYWRAYELAKTAAEAGFEPARPLAGKAWDRWLLSTGEPQDYGTQTRQDDGGLRLFAISGDATDADRARWRLPDLETAIRAVLDAGGHTGPATLDTLRTLGLIVEAGVEEAPLPAPELPRCADFEPPGGAAAGGALDLTVYRAAIGVGFASGVAHAGAIDGSLPEGGGALLAPVGSPLVLRFDPPIALYQFQAIDLADRLTLQAFAGQVAIFPEPIEIVLGSEDWAPGGRLYLSGLPQLVDRLELTSAEPEDVWGIDALCVGP